jgi:HEAT repeat protein
MKTTHMILILTACGLWLAGRGLYADDAPVSAITAKELKSDKEADKIKGLDALAARGEKAAEAVKPIEELLKDKSATVRAHAALALGAIGLQAKDSVTALAQLLKDPEDVVRRSALRALRSIHPGPPVMVPICTKLLEDPDPAMRVRVLGAIADCGVEAVPGLIAALKDDKAAYWALIILRDIGPAAKDAVPAIIEKLKDKQPRIRMEAVLTLGALGDAADTAEPQIAELLSDPNARTAATFVLGRLGKIPTEAEATIRANTKSEDQLLSTASYWALAKVHPEDKQLRAEATEKLVVRLKDKDEFVRAGAARALASLPPAPEITVPIFEKLLKDADETTMHNAMDALAALGPVAVPRLIDALKYEKFRIDVVYALGRLGPAAAPATAELAKLVDDKNSRLANEAIIALGDIGPAAKDAVPALTKALDQPVDKDMNFTAIAFALGKIGPAAAAAEPVLLKKLDNATGNVRFVSAWALAQIAPTSPDVAAKAVPVLIAGLAMSDDRLLSAEGLCGFGSLAKGAAESLKKLAGDENKVVQEAVAKALKAVEQTTAVAAAGGPIPGDLVVTTVDKLEIGMKGSQGEIVPKGTKLKVYEIRGKWIGVKIADQEKTGWVLAEQIAKP